MALTTLESYASDTKRLPLTINFQPKSPTSEPHSTEEDAEKAGVSLDDTPPAQLEKLTVPPLDWDNEDDPDDPFNWPMWKRMYNTMIPGLLGLAVTFGSSVYTPGYPQVAREFGVSSTAALLPLSLWTLGLGFGPMLGAPASEMFGRKVVYMFSTPISLLFTMGAGLSPSFAGLVVCRLLGGVFGSPVCIAAQPCNTRLTDGTLSRCLLLVLERYKICGLPSIVHEDSHRSSLRPFLDLPLGESESNEDL